MDWRVALDAAKQDIAKRLRRVCLGIREDEFEALITRMAEIDVRYRLRDDWAPYRDPLRRARPALG